MKVKEIIELIDFISSTDLNEVKVETEEIKLNVKKSADTQIIEAPVQAIAPVAAPAPAPTPVAAPVATPAVEVSAPAAASGTSIKSPMIGTFYRSANPDAPMFVNVGDKVEKGQTVCIIEAMKLFNEIEADVSGTIVEVCVENAQPVEFDQPLFIVDPS